MELERRERPRTLTARGCFASWPEKPCLKAFQKASASVCLQPLTFTQSGKVVHLRQLIIKLLLLFSRNPAPHVKWLLETAVIYTTAPPSGHVLRRFFCLATISNNQVCWNSSKIVKRYYLYKRRMMPFLLMSIKRWLKSLYIQ